MVEQLSIFRMAMGQHVGTSLAQIVAEELGLRWNDVTIDYLKWIIQQWLPMGSTYWG